ncbi:DUF2190 family protein [Paracidovorax citrulli]|uniref:DUF2190 family protein n=1 Tax=Paracidovorax citrulli TaxID=80869 RepID=A0ABY9AK93_PARCI|nr:capsid cement protein [Paracidovorax citrulli]ATG94675.1 hypothetical protein CQB05_12090 [Paracidovorax citrulli]MVT28550.1 hypothetical protein [Paracidovorax citrulli]MVT38596.1 hypothetical protein [Paracidovorax citrulli]PVY66514.1 hypothetical protein C8E08_3922 [Paracidovorax citrulli]QCX12189.1 structural protein [Paracidovorax citrulli]
MADVLVEEVTTILAQEADSSVLREEVEVIQVVADAEQGPPGPRGEVGPAGGATVSRVAGSTLSALIAAWEDAAGRVYALDKDDEDHVYLLLGITLTAADPGQPINVQRSGVITDSAWSWTPGQRIYLGLGGALTTAAPAVGFDVLIGTALSPTRLLLNLQDPIALE